MKHTPLHTAHIELKGRMVEFGGWHMPIQYSSLVAEHKCVRENVGLFDVSHMGEILVSGKDAESFLQKATTNNVASLKIGQAQYSAICNNEGNPVDDILVYKRSSDSFLLCVNASNIQKDFEWLQSIKTTEKMSMEMKLVAL